MLPERQPDMDLIEGTTPGTIKTDGNTLATSRPGIFAGGDAVSGTKFIVDAIAAGHRAAVSIDRYLKGDDLKQAEPAFRKVELSEEEIAQRIKSREKRQEVRVKREGQVKSFTEVEPGFSEEQALREAGRCLDCSICSECLQCLEACGPGAIEHDMPGESLLDIKVGAVILAAGSDIFDPDLKKEYGYKRYPNVITSLQFERILSASGPYGGKVLRPHDEKEPGRIAFIQCVGSRDTERMYCSAICCMAATKEAIVAKEHRKELDCTIFFTDMRAFGKGFEDYYKRALELGVRYIRCRPSSIREVPGTKNLRIKYSRDAGDITGNIIEEIFDLVVLSVGLQPLARTQELEKN